LGESNRNNIAVLRDVYEKIRQRYTDEQTDVSFVKWFSDYVLMNLEKDEYLSTYAPNLHKIGITDNILYLKDSKKNKIVEIRMVNGKLHSNDADPMYLLYGETHN